MRIIFYVNKWAAYKMFCNMYPVRCVVADILSLMELFLSVWRDVPIYLCIYIYIYAVCCWVIIISVDVVSKHRSVKYNKRLEVMEAILCPSRNGECRPATRNLNVHAWAVHTVEVHCTYMYALNSHIHSTYTHNSERMNERTRHRVVMCVTHPMTLIMKIVAWLH